MITEISERNICNTCNEIGKCVFFKPESSTIFFCEEFDNYICLQKKPIFGSEPAQINEYGDNMGLHKNCDNRNTCLYNKKNEANWYCEEHL